MGNATTRPTTRRIIPKRIMESPEEWELKPVEPHVSQHEVEQHLDGVHPKDIVAFYEWAKENDLTLQVRIRSAMLKLNTKRCECGFSTHSWLNRDKAEAELSLHQRNHPPRKMLGIPWPKKVQDA